MSVFDDLAALRRAIQLSGPDGASLPPTHSSLGAINVSSEADGSIRLLSVDVREPLTVSDMEAVFGSATPQPRVGPGRPDVVLFPDTIPDDGAVGATVMADVDGDQVTRIMLRRDEFPPLDD